MTKPTTLAWMTCAVLAVHTGAHAQSPNNGSSHGPGDGPGHRTDDRASPGRPIEITPYVLIGPSASGVGAAVRWPVGARLGVELETDDTLFRVVEAFDGVLDCTENEILIEGEDATFNVTRGLDTNGLCKGPEDGLLFNFQAGTEGNELFVDFITDTFRRQRLAERFAGSIG